MGFSRFPLAALAAAIASAPALASDLNYTYVEGGYVYSDIDDPDVDGDGLFLGGSFAIHESVFLFANYTDLSFDFGIDLSAFQFGVGANYPINERVDFVGKLAYVDAEAESGGFDADDSGLGLAGGVRGKLGDQFELEAMINYVDLDDSGDSTSVAFDARYYVTSEFALGGGVSLADDETTWRLVLRYEIPNL